MTKRTASMVTHLNNIADALKTASEETRQLAVEMESTYSKPMSNEEFAKCIAKASRDMLAACQKIWHERSQEVEQQTDSGLSQHQG